MLSQIKKLCYLYTTEFYSAIKKYEILSFAGKWVELENIIFFLFSFFKFFLFLLFYYSYVHTKLGSFLPPAPTPSLTTHTTPSLSPPLPQYPAETILPLSLILLKREYKQ
jgi:hypothetical protein